MRATATFHSHLSIGFHERGMVKDEKRAMCETAVGIGRTTTAQHGVGKIRLGEMSLCIDPKSLELMRGLKRLFDPNGILNPGTAIP